jgi:CRP/FNR family transcriptional regulator, cyclic AMP receptor protein
MTLTPPGEPGPSTPGPETSRELSLLAALFEEAHLPAQAVLTREDEPGRQAFVIIEGRVAVTVGARAAGELGPGDVVEGVARVQFGSRPATTTALTPLHVLVIGPQTAAAMRQRPGVAQRLAARLGKRWDQ